MVYGSQYDDQTGLILRDSDSGDERCHICTRDEQESIAPLNYYLPCHLLLITKL